jgi:hypothetical protein
MSSPAKAAGGGGGGGGGGVAGMVDMTAIEAVGKGRGSGMSERCPKSP